jgi:SIR2-like domain
VADEIPEIPPIPEGLREAAQRGTLIPFVGAGASKLAGCPNWAEFAEAVLRYFISQGKLTHNQLAQLSRLSPRVKLSVASALQEEHQIPINFANILHPSDQAMSNQLGLRLYQSLNGLGRTYVTTNYDGWLDRAMPPPPSGTGGRAPATSTTAGATPAIAAPRRVVYKVTELVPSLLNEGNTVIHLHGSMQEPAGMIMSTQNYVRHYANDRQRGELAQENRVLTFLDYLFSNRTVLFIGYGLDELEILEYVILKARQLMSGTPPEAKHYLLQGFFSNEQELYRSLRSYYLRECGIELLPFLRDYRDWEQLVHVMDHYAREVPASSAIALQEFKDMEQMLDG